MTPLRPDQLTFLALYKELVETNTTLSAGSCTLAAERLADHLKSAGFRGRRYHVIFGARPSQGRWAGGDIAGNQQNGEAHAAARPPRCRRGQARGLDPRSVYARRGERLFLRARRGRHEGDGCDLGRCADAIQAERLPAQAHHQAGADLRRRDDLRFQRCRLAGQEPAGLDLRGVRVERGRRRPHRWSRQAAGAVDAGRGKGRTELSAGDGQCRRPQLDPDPRQRDL